MKEFNVLFYNNLSERTLSMLEIKIKVSDVFRSGDGRQNYCNTISIIYTAKK